MAKEQTENSRYKSRFSESFVTAAQYITELICEKHARYNKRDLIREFWKLPEWAKHYKQQIPTACKLLKKYDGGAIIAALLSQKAWNIYSLRAPHLIPIIEEEQRVFDLKQEKLLNAPTLNVSKDDTHRSNTKKSKLEMLDE